MSTKNKKYDYIIIRYYDENTISIDEQIIDYIIEKTKKVNLK